MQILTNLVPVFNTILILCASLGALWAYRNGIAKTLNEVQDRVINALKNEIEACKDRLDRVEKENERLNQLLSTIRSALRQRGLYITIDGEMVSIHDQQGSTTQTSRIHGTLLSPKDEEV